MDEIKLKSQLISMSELISKQIDKVTNEKMECHPALVKFKELERQKWIAKAETMIEVLNLFEE